MNPINVRAELKTVKVEWAERWKFSTHSALLRFSFILIFHAVEALSVQRSREMGNCLFQSWYSFLHHDVYLAFSSLSCVAMAGALFSSSHMPTRGCRCWDYFTEDPLLHLSVSVIIWTTPWRRLSTLSAPQPIGIVGSTQSSFLFIPSPLIISGSCLETDYFIAPRWA